MTSFRNSEINPDRLRTPRRQAADDYPRDIDSLESHIHGAQAGLADNGWAQDGQISAGETVQGLVINGQR